MKILIASTIVPFVQGGGTLIVDWLETALRERGHEVEVLRLPFWEQFRERPRQSLALRLLEVAGDGDRLIAIRPPSYLLRHPSKVLWFIHHHRGAYDLWGTKHQDPPDTPLGRAYREQLVRSDHLAFSEARAIYANSAVVAGRLRRYNGIDAEVLYPPVFRPELYRCDGYGDYILYFSRVAHFKRQQLAVEAMQHTRTPVKLMIAGPADDEDSEISLRREVERCGVQDKVSLDLKWVSDDAKRDYYARCLAAIYIPFDEDSYGYPSLEAHHSGKAVITTTDAGGTSELIVDGQNGILTEPTPRALADSMDRLYLNRREAEDMGKAGVGRIEALGITWDRVAERLLA